MRLFLARCTLHTTTFEHILDHLPYVWSIVFQAFQALPQRISANSVSCQRYPGRAQLFPVLGSFHVNTFSTTCFREGTNHHNGIQQEAVPKRKIISRVITKDRLPANLLREALEDRAV